MLFDDLRAQYLENRLVVFVGAGVSHAGGLPAWPGLIQHVLTDVRTAASAAELPALDEAAAALARGDLIRALGELQAATSSAVYGRAVSRALDDSRHPVPALARAIASLAPTLHAAITTNLDRFLERAFSGNWPTFTLPHLDLGQQKHYILQLHGNRTDRSSWVLGERDYEELLHGRPELQRFVEGLFRFHTLLFVGYDLRDPDFDRLCGQMRVVSRGQAPRHFALVPEGKVGNYERRRLADAGIELLAYANPDGSHAELLCMLHDLAASQPGTNTSASIASLPLAVATNVPQAPEVVSLTPAVSTPRRYHRWMWPIITASAAVTIYGLIGLLSSPKPFEPTIRTAGVLNEMLRLTRSMEERDNEWCTRVVNPMYKRFAGRYPFDADADAVVRIADFEAFFHPESGEIRKAREDLLGDWVTIHGNDIEARNLPPNSGHLDPDVVEFLNRAQEIGMDMFFADELGVDFDISLGCNGHVHRVEFKIGGEKHTVDCSPYLDQNLPPQSPGTPMHMPSVRLRWPSKEERGASLTAWGRQTKKTFEESSEWGLFKILERYSTVLELDDPEIQFQFDFTAYDLGLLMVWLKPVRIRSGNTFFEKSGQHAYISLLRAANVLPPKRLFITGGCSSANSGSENPP